MLRAVEHNSFYKSRYRVLHSELEDLTLPITRKEYHCDLELLGREWMTRLEQPDDEEDWRRSPR